MLTERTTTLFVSIFYFQKCQTRDCNIVGAIRVQTAIERVIFIDSPGGF